MNQIDVASPPLGVTSATASVRLVRWLPALVLAQLALALWVTVRLWFMTVVPLPVVLLSVVNHLLFLLRALPLLGVLSWPLAAMQSPRRALGAVAALWSVFLLFQGALEQYFLITRVPLGADLFAYDLSEIRTTTGGSWSTSGLWDRIGVLIPLVVLVIGLVWRGRRTPATRPFLLLGLQAVGVVTWALPLSPGAVWLDSESMRGIVTSRGAYFVADNLRWWRSQRGDETRELPTDLRDTMPAPGWNASTASDEGAAPTPQSSAPVVPGWSPSAPPPDSTLSSGEAIGGASGHQASLATFGLPVLAPLWRAVTATTHRATQGTTVAQEYPFWRGDATPDVLGPYFAPTRNGRPPNVVVIVVEGLGRSFSGPDAALGSFTPFLDDLARRSLYFENFLANQGRTFGVLPALISSLPVADQGFAALGAEMPPHAGLFNVLKRQGYRTAFYTGTNAEFDNMRLFLDRQSVDDIVDLGSFGAGYQRNPFSEWGYPDRELVSRALADTARLRPPFVVGMLTISMHTNYQFPGQEVYKARLESHLQSLRVPEARRAPYRANDEIFSAILYTDDQLRRYFESVATAPWYPNTIFIVTGDHRLSEIPQDTYIERFHVPLLVFSPLLRRPARVRAVSSHLDVTPSLLALLSNTYGLLRPEQVTWTGSGLDLSESFRNLHEIPLKLAKTSVPDYVSGRWFLREGRLFELQEGMGTAEVDNADLLAQVRRRFQGYLDANARFMKRRALSPEGATPRLVPYRATTAPTPNPAMIALPPGLTVDGVRLSARSDSVRLFATFTNGEKTGSPTFVPMAVLTDEDGRELQERYGAALKLGPGARREIVLAFPTPRTPGRYFLSVRPSDPNSGKPVGRGRFRIPFDISAPPG